jgi:hypothetical protein
MRAAKSRGSCQGDIGGPSIIALGSKVCAQLHDAARFSEHDQPYIRSPLKAAGPTSRVRRARAQAGEAILIFGFFKPSYTAIRPPGSRTDQGVRIAGLGASGRSPAKKLSTLKRRVRAHGRRPALRGLWFGNVHRPGVGCVLRGLGGGVERQPVGA